MSNANLPDIDVVIVNWNTRGLLVDCVRSLTGLAGKHCSLGRVIVVDNASTDDSLSRLKAAQDTSSLPLQIVENKENRGFAAACNQGASFGRASYLLFLNPDTRVLPGSLDVPVAFLESPENSRVGICGIQIIDGNGDLVSGCYRFPTLLTIFGQMTNLASVLPAVFPPHQMAVDELQERKPVDQVIGAFFVVRRKVFDLLEGFDERFFVYFEEVDFAYRAKQRGILSYFVPEASVYHVGGGSTNLVRARRLFLSLRSRLKYARKHLGVARTAIVGLLTVTVELTARLTLAAARRSPSAAIETLSAYRQLCSAGLGAVGAKLRSVTSIRHR